MNNSKRFRHLLMSMCGIWLLAVVLVLATLSQSLAFTLNVVDQNGSSVVTGFRWLLEEDNTNITVPFDPVVDSISLDIHNSHAPLVTKGTAVSATTR